MSRCIWVAGSPRSGTNFTALFLNSCGIPAWYFAPVIGKNDWNLEWAEDPILIQYLSSLLGNHPDVSLPNPIQRQEGSLELGRYLTSRDQAQPNDFILKSNWLPFVSDFVLKTLPKREHVLVVCKRPEEKIAASLSARTNTCCKEYISLVLKATKELQNRFQGQIIEVDFERMKYDKDNVLSELLNKLNLSPGKNSYDLYKREQVRY